MENYWDEYNKKVDSYRKMTLQELERLSDDELFEAIAARMQGIADAKESLADVLYGFNDSQLAFFSGMWYEGEVNNGGLCQFFVNSSSVIAPIISDVLRIIGAEDHEKLYSEFIRSNGIDVKDLSSFKIQAAEEFATQEKRYPFDAFDFAFYQMKPVQHYLTVFARAHLSELA